jgi:hypothetical protein
LSGEVRFHHPEFKRGREDLLRFILRKHPTCEWKKNAEKKRRQLDVDADADDLWDATIKMKVEAVLLQGKQEELAKSQRMLLSRLEQLQRNGKEACTTVLNRDEKKARLHQRDGLNC